MGHFFHFFPGNGNGNGNENGHGRPSASRFRTLPSSNFYYFPIPYREVTWRVPDVIPVRIPCIYIYIYIYMVYVYFIFADSIN
jgi:hypothetical protein